MLNYRTAFFSFLFLSFLGFLISGDGRAEPLHSPKFVPPDGKVLLFIGQDKRTINNYLKNFQTVPAGFMTYTSIQDVDGLSSPSPDRGGGVHFADYFLKRYPDTAVQIGLYLVGALDGVTAGHYDGNIQRLAVWLKSTRRPVYLRIGYEFDLPDNQYDPAKYRSAYRYIVDRLRGSGVDNVAFVWHSHGFFFPDRPFLAWYPGDDYVDWFGVSFFDCYNESNLRRIAKLAREHHKPLMIAEASAINIPTTSGEKSWNTWFRRFFEFVEREKVQAVCYIDNRWGRFPMFKNLNWPDARLEAHPLIKTRWQEETGKDKYLHASNQLFDILDFHY